MSHATTANTCIAKLTKATNVSGPNRAYEPPKIIEKDVDISDSVFGLDRRNTLLSGAAEVLEPGAALFYQKCTLCHVPREPKTYSFKEWQGITATMFVNAGATEDERALILEYLRKNAKDAK